MDISVIGIGTLCIVYWNSYAVSKDLVRLL